MSIMANFSLMRTVCPSDNRHLSHGRLLYRKRDAEAFVQLVHDADECRISVANYVEMPMVIENQLGPEGMGQAEAFFRRAGITIEPVILEQGELARQAFLDFGKGRHKAGLNYGDCFSNALARATGEPLLFKGNDFTQMDISPA
jgi:ribonuclease VapC